MIVLVSQVEVGMALGKGEENGQDRESCAGIYDGSKGDDKMGRRPVSTKKVKQLMGDWKVSQWECCVGQNMGIRIYANHGM